MTVHLVDLRDATLRATFSRTLGSDAAGGHLVTPSGREPKDLAIAPPRLFILLPIDAHLANDAEALALALVGVDPQPRTIVAAVDGSGGDADSAARERVLPNEFARSPEVRFLDLRSRMLIVGHPRSGSTQVGIGEGDPSVLAFVADLVGQLRERSVFDAVWQSIPRDQPATVGMRVATLGAGRERAVADLAIRLAEEIRPDREAEMGRRLPDRWQILDGLLPEAIVNVAAPESVTRSIEGLAAVADEGPLRILARSPSDYNGAAADQLTVLAERPAELARLFDRAEASAEGPEHPRIDPVGATDLDRALGGVIFGDPVARAAEEGADAAEWIGGLLAQAAERQADGLPAAVLAGWLRADADRVAPMGPAMVAAKLRDPSTQWSVLSSHIGRQGSGVPREGSRHWLTSTAGGRTNGNAASPNTAAEPSEADPDADTPKRKRKSKTSAVAATVDVPQARQVPRGLGWVLGSPIWRHRPIGFAYLLLTTLVVVLAVLQIWVDVTGAYFVRAADLGLSDTTASILRWLLLIAGAALIGYAVLSLYVAGAVRRWARDHRFEEGPVAVTTLEEEARRLAVLEVARCAVRRDYARVARAAADTLEQASTRASQASMAFGRETEAAAAGRSPVNAEVSPHRRLLGGSDSLTGTDAGGIYRIYPMYVHALRGLFAQSLVTAVRERWPRVRGVFWADTAEMIGDLAVDSLRERLERVLAFGLRRGDLTRNGVDPADELAARLWSDPKIREDALEALQFEAHDPMPILASPADNRLLDATIDAPLIFAIPSTLEPLLRPSADRSGASIVVTDALETATAIRVFPFRPGLYDFVDQAQPDRPRADG